MIDTLKYVHFIDNKRHQETSIDYICWFTQDKKFIKINNEYKAPNNHYYEFNI